MEKKKKKVKVGKSMTTLIILIFAIIGICLVFSQDPVEKMTAYQMLLKAILPYLLPVLLGVASKGVVTGIIQQTQLPRSNLSVSSEENPREQESIKNGDLHG